MFPICRSFRNWNSSFNLFFYPLNVLRRMAQVFVGNFLTNSTISSPLLLLCTRCKHCTFAAPAAMVLAATRRSSSTYRLVCALFWLLCPGAHCSLLCALWPAHCSLGPIGLVRNSESPSFRGGGPHSKSSIYFLFRVRFLISCFHKYVLSDSLVSDIICLSIYLSWICFLIVSTLTPYNTQGVYAK